MKQNGKSAPAASHPSNPSSLFTLATGWMQQGVESFFATQRILVDLAMRQNLNLMKTFRDELSNPEHSPVALLTELAAEGTSTFIETQRILLDLAHQETELMMTGVKERVGDYPPAVAMTEMIRRSMGTFIAMQRDFLTTANKQATQCLHAVKAGPPYDGEPMIQLAGEAMEHFESSARHRRGVRL